MAYVIRNRADHIASFLEKTIIDPDRGCWMWTGARDTAGYGLMWRPRILRRSAKPVVDLAHRLAYDFFVGPIPDGLVIDHLCRVHLCVCPQHLEPVTALENIRRGDAGAPKRILTHCPHGHPYSGDNLIRTRKGRACKTCARYQARVYHRERYVPLGYIPKHLRGPQTSD